MGTQKSLSKCHSSLAPLIPLIHRSLTPFANARKMFRHLSFGKALSFQILEDALMYRSIFGVAASLALVSAVALAATPAEKVGGTDSIDESWSAANAEKIKAIQAKGNVWAGAESYKAYCEACHLSHGQGNPDGSIPQLAGQHSSVLIKQLADIRSGLRYNPTMQPFARKLADAQEVANVAAYISTLCIPLDSGKYAGPATAETVSHGKLLYEKECSQCHQPRGQGFKDMFYPVLAGQHYKYLLRQMTDIRDGRRGNSDPVMVRIVKNYNDDQLVAISAYMASLTTPFAMLMPPGSMCLSPSAKGAKVK
mgnify:FL=1|jgi:cytochrome c553